MRQPARRSNRQPIWLAGLLLLLIGLFQYGVPVFRDEAYFIAWGHDLAAGYYDHPPLTGWIAAILVWAGDVLGLERHAILHRVFSLLLGAAALVLVYRRLGALSEAEPGAACQRGYLIAALILTPGTLLMFNMFVNDTLVAFASLVFLLAMHDLWRAPTFSVLYTALAGLALAAMLMTKYSSAIIYLGLVLALLFMPGGGRFLITRLLAVSAIAAMPFVWNLWWNYNNCAVNFAFNFSFRNEKPTGGPLPALIGTLLLVTGVMSFQFLWLRLRLRKAGRAGGQFFAPIFLATLLLSLLIALARGNFGANWAAVYGFLAILALAEMAGIRSARFAARFSLAMALLLSLPILLVLTAFKSEVLRPSDFLDEAQAYSHALTLDMNDAPLVAALQALGEGRVFGAPRYGMTSMMKNARLSPALTLSRSVYGRNDDLFVDLRQLDGRDFLLLAKNPARAEALAQAFFNDYEIHEVEGVHGAYQVVLADGFMLESYLEDWLRPFIRDRYEAAPFPYRSCPLDRYR